MDLKGKQVLVMGLGLHGGGAGAVEFLARRGAQVTVTDLRTRKELAPSLAALAAYRGVRYVLGRHREADFRATDMVLKNPGVRRDHPLLIGAARRGIPIVSDVGIFFRLCPGRIIGITGTRGKSTTTWLIWKFLRAKYGKRAHYGGNIRRSVLSILPQIKKGDLVVLELSSFQLADLAYERMSPAVAVLTPLMTDHLNWHRNMREYLDAKRAIFRFQRPDEDLFVYRQDRAVLRLAAAAPSRIRTASLPGAFKKIVDENLGRHYRPSAALAVAVALRLSVPRSAMQKILHDFRGLPGREEEIGVRHGIHFINDTTATIPDAAIAAITRFRRRAGKQQFILIAGGQDKKLDFSGMAAVIRQWVDVLVLLPGTGTEKLKRAWKYRDRMSKSRELRRPILYHASTMQEAVRMAWKEAREGDHIVLSPGAASFGLFLNEFDRGDQFAAAVLTLRKHKTQ